MNELEKKGPGEGTSFSEIIRYDASAHFIQWRGVRTFLWAMLYHGEFFCIIWYRINSELAKKGYKKLSIILKYRRIQWFGNDISPESQIGPGLVLGHLCGIVIGKGVRIGRNFRVQQNVTIGSKYFTIHPNILGEKIPALDVPTIGDNVAIGTGAVVVGEIHIGNNVKIGALSFIDRDIPADSVAYGIPPNLTVKSNKK